MIKYLKRLFNKESRADKNERLYRNWLNNYVPKHTNTVIQLDRCFTDRNGNNLYYLKNPAHLTKERQQAIEEALKAAEFGIEKKEILDKLTVILEGIKDIPYQTQKKDDLRKFIEKSTYDIGDLLYRMKSINNEDLMIQAGLYLIFIDNENPYVLNPETQQRKWELVKNDDEVRAFFLNLTEVVLRSSINTSVETSQN